MRLLSKKIITIAALVLPLMAWAQPKEYPDSIRVELPEQESFIIFELRRYVDNKKIITDFPARLSRLLDHIEKSIPSGQQQTPHTVEVIYEDRKDDKGEFLMRIVPPKQPETSVTVVSDAIVQLIPPGWNVTIQDKLAMIHLYVPDIERLRQLSVLNLDPVISHLDTDPDIFHHKRMGTISRVILSEGTVNSTLDSHRNPGDMLGLHAGAGVGLLQEKWYPEFNFSTALYFSNRFKPFHQRFMFNYDLKLFSGINERGDHFLAPATFLSFSYGLNFAKEKPRWTALGIGYLVHNKSDIFKGKTLRLFLETDIGSQKLNIVPELFLTDDFRKSMFGIKLNYRF